VSAKSEEKKFMSMKVIRLALCAMLLALSFSAQAQQAKKVPRIGFIFNAGTSARPSRSFDAFQQGLRDLGYIEGQNLIIERRYSEGRLDRMPTLVDELVQRKVDVIVATNNVVIRSAKEATKIIPIVMVSSIDPVIAGYVDSLARPGGNITGISFLARDLSAKRVELLKEVLPRMSRVAILWDADGPEPNVAFKEYQAASRTFKLDLQSLEVRRPNPDLENAFQAAKKKRDDALIIVASPLTVQHQKQVLDLATKNRLPTMNETSQYVDAGGLLSYGANWPIHTGVLLHT
jgi:putative tryptophan/tyrosine transport system substrate-binding protein